MTEKAVFLLILILTIGCQNSSPSLEPAPGEPFEIEFGRQLTIPEEDIRLQFLDVAEDSRCPKGVDCFWSGNAKIALRFNDHTIHLNTHLDPKQVTISNYTIELISLSPYPVYEVEVEEEEYTAELLITQN